MRFISPASAIPNPLDHESAESYQAAIVALAEQHPSSIYEFAIYAFQLVADVKGRDSIFQSRNRIAMPDETLFFGTGNDRDRALLLYTLLHHSAISDPESVIGLSEVGSFVRHGNTWIDAGTLSILAAEPAGLIIWNTTPQGVS